MKRTSSREHSALLKWLEQGAPPDKDHPLPRPAPVHRTGAGGLVDRDERARNPANDSVKAEGATIPRRSHVLPQLAEVEATLGRGLGRLPLDARQRARAKALARDAIALLVRPAGSRGGGGLSSVAAAIAYAIVYVDHVPLTQADVAACFRVSVASLRGRFGELRTQLDLLPGDARYATLPLR
jgi:hypothetical protein